MLIVVNSLAVIYISRKMFIINADLYKQCGSFIY